MVLKFLKSSSSISKLISSRHFVVIALFLFISCDKDDPITDSSEPMLDLASERQKMAQLVAEHFIRPAYVNLRGNLEKLSSTSESFSTHRSEESLVALRDALKETWLSWQDAAIYQFGPTENNALRATINLYPSDQTKIESNISSANYTFGSIANKGAEGLPALDYLVNVGSIAEVLSAHDQQNRRNYLLAVVESLKEVVDKVAMQWLDGAFLQDFASEQSKGTDVGSALGLLTNAIDLHFQRFLRDGKVAIPAGVRSAGVPRPKAVESLHGGYSRELLVRSLQAYQNLFDGLGIDDQRGTSYYQYLEHIDQAGIAADLKSHLDAAIAKCSKLDNSFSEQIEKDNQALIDVFLSLQEIVTLIKSDMASVLGITITNQDNDGD